MKPKVKSNLYHIRNQHLEKRTHFIWIKFSYSEHQIQTVLYKYLSRFDRIVNFLRMHIRRWSPSAKVGPFSKSEFEKLRRTDSKQTYLLAESEGRLVFVYKQNYWRIIRVCRTCYFKLVFIWNFKILDVGKIEVVVLGTRLHFFGDFVAFSATKNR